MYEISKLIVDSKNNLEKQRTNNEYWIGGYMSLGNLYVVSGPSGAGKSTIS